MRSNDDNLVNAEQKQRLATWAGLNAEELCLVLKDCKGVRDFDRAAACDLLIRCLHPKAEQRPTMEAVLELAFFSGRASDTQLILDNQATMMGDQKVLHEDIQEVTSKIGTLFDELKQVKVCVLLLRSVVHLNRSFL